MGALEDATSEQLREMGRRHGAARKWVLLGIIAVWIAAFVMLFGPAFEPGGDSKGRGSAAAIFAFVMLAGFLVAIQRDRHGRAIKARLRELNPVRRARIETFRRKSAGPQGERWELILRVGDERLSVDTTVPKNHAHLIERDAPLAVWEGVRFDGGVTIDWSESHSLQGQPDHDDVEQGPPERARIEQYRPLETTGSGQRVELTLRVSGKIHEIEAEVGVLHARLVEEGGWLAVRRAGDDIHVDWDLSFEWSRDPVQPGYRGV